jgi:hypothetical protein
LQRCFRRSEFKPGFADCLISFEAPTTECEAYVGALFARGPIEAADRTFAQNYDPPQLFYEESSCNGGGQRRYCCGAA